MVNAKPTNFSYWLFGCDLPVREFPTDDEATEYQKMIEEEKEEELVVC